MPGNMRQVEPRDSDATMMPLNANNSAMWGGSGADLRSPSPYKDYSSGRATPSGEFDPYTHSPVRQGY